jgi:hypothetical protein
MSPSKRRRKKKKNKKKQKNSPADDGDADEQEDGNNGNEDSSESEDDEKKWVEAFRFSFNKGAVALVQCPLYAVCPAAADPGDVIELDLLGLDELCATIPRTKPVPPPGSENKKKVTKGAGPPAPDIIFPPDGGLVRQVLRTNAPPKLLLEIPRGVEPGKRFRTSFDGHAILTVTEIAPAPPDGVPQPLSASALDPLVGGGALLLEELWVPSLHGKTMQLQQRVLETDPPPPQRQPEEAPTSDQDQSQLPSVDVSRYFFENAPPDFGGIKPVGLAAAGWAQHASTTRQLPLTEGAYERPVPPAPEQPEADTAGSAAAEAGAAVEPAATAGGAEPEPEPEPETEP